MVKTADQISREMELMGARIAKEFSSHVDRNAILIMMDEEIQKRIERSVQGIIDTYSDSELIQARHEYERVTDVVRAQQKKGKKH